MNFNNRSASCPKHSRSKASHEHHHNSGELRAEQIVYSSLKLTKSHHSLCQYQSFNQNHHNKTQMPSTVIDRQQQGHHESQEPYKQHKHHCHHHHQHGRHQQPKPEGRVQVETQSKPQPQPQPQEPVKSLPPAFHASFRHHKSSPALSSCGSSSGSGSGSGYGYGLGGERTSAVRASTTTTSKSTFYIATPPPSTASLISNASSTGSTWSTGWGSVSARRNSSYHSYDDLDAAATKSIASAAERKVVSSLKYLCACTGATLRNLSKKTKDLHAKNYCYTKPTWRLWGEEHEKNAIFTVYLKKVRYHRPTPTPNNDSDDEISHLEWETVRVRFVKAATLARLVEALATDDGELESTFINVFLSTYRTFSTPKEVLNLLIRRYDTLNEKHLEEMAEHQMHTDNKYDPNGSIHEQHKKTLVSAIHVWLDGFPEDWNEDNLRQVLAFAAKRLPRSDLHMKVLHRLERLLRQQVYGEHQQQHNGPPWLVGGSVSGGAASHGSLAPNAATSNVSVMTGSGLGAGMGMGIGMGVGVGILPSATSHYNNELVEQFGGMCLTPAFRGPTHFLQAFRFPHVPVRHFAEQLTRMDSELFKRLIPHQCLGATWARRDKSGSETVVATINQFNAVLFRVISSILIEPRLKPQERALNIATWIDIAQELRLLKNFSSLKAIISGLQSNPIYRLSKIWAVLPKEKMEIFNELARIFSEDNNAWAQREVLMREGTAKFADTVGEHDRHLQKIIQKQSHQTSHGTIPYLGTFLTDLTMIHAAIPDTIGDEELINFDKKRKEFEVLAQIKLLQGAANTYNLREDPNFDRWFASMLVLDEREAHTLSCQLESPPPAPRKSTTSNNITTLSTHHNSSTSNSIGHRKTDSIASNSSSGAGSQFYCEINSGGSFGSHYSSRHNSLDRDTQCLPNVSLMSASSSVSNLSLDSSNSGGQKSLSNNSKMTHSLSANGVHQQRNDKDHRTPTSSSNGSSTPLINAQLVQTSAAKANAPDFYIIRVTYETDNIELDGIVLYKSIMLGNNERTPQVIRNAMMKLGLDDDPERYTLAQVLPDKELVMPKNANVYYAVNTNYNLNFILRPKKDGAS